MFWTIDASLETLISHRPPEAQAPVRRLGDDSGETTDWSIAAARVPVAEVHWPVPTQKYPLAQAPDSS